jgi:predicted ester cyclase
MGMAEEESTSEATTKVQEVAANMQQAAIRRKRITGPKAGKAETVARGYFAAIDARDLDAAVSLWAPGGRENVRGRVDVIAPEGVREFIGELFGAVPDLNMQVVSTTSEAERCGVHWRMTGTFAGPGRFGGVAPTGNPIVLEGFDLLTVRDGLIESNDAFTDSMTFARQIGMMPRQGSVAEQRMTGAFNAKTRLTGTLGSGEAELVAEGVWVVQGQPGRCNVYLIEDDGSVTLFDAGGRTMTRAVARAGAKLGASAAWCWDTDTQITVAWRPRSACRCSATPTRCRTRKAAAAFATGLRGSRACRRRSASSTACCTATPGTEGR